MDNHLSYLDCDLFDHACLRCKEPLPGYRAFHELQELARVIDDVPYEDEFSENLEYIREEFYDEFDGVLEDTLGLCDGCRLIYERQWGIADEKWMHAAFRNIPNRIKRQRAHHDVVNYFRDEEEFATHIRPKLVFCRIFHPALKPSIDRYWPDDFSDLRGSSTKPPYAERTVRVIPQKINSGLASGRVTSAELRLMRYLRRAGLTQTQIAARTGRSISTVCRKLKGQFLLTIGMT